MATTPRLGLYKPVGTDLVDVTTALNTQLDIIDSKAFNTLVSDEASPPVAEFVGQEWFTKDSKKWFFWNGTIWKEIPFPVDTGSTSAAGTGKKALTIGAHTTNLFSTTTNQENGPLFPTTINAEEGKYYRVCAHATIVTLDTTSPAKAFINIRVASGTTVTSTGSLVANTYIAPIHFISGNVNEYAQIAIQGVFNSTAKQQLTFGLFLQKDSTMTGSLGFGPVNAPFDHYQAMWVEEL